MAARDDTPKLRLLTGPQAEQEFDLIVSAMDIGLNQYNDIVIADHDVVQKYAVIKQKGIQWYIQKASTHVVLSVNRHSLDEAILQNKDVIDLGSHISFRFIDERGIKTEKAPDSAAAHKRKMPFLKISISSIYGSKTYDLDKPLTKVGRDGKNDIVIQSSIVSRWHFEVLRNGDKCILLHANGQRNRTRNGLRYEGHHILGSQPFRQVLKHGDVFRIGSDNEALVTITYNDGRGAPSIILPEVKPFKLGKEKITIGRSANNDLVLAHSQVSNHHACLERVMGNDYCLVDLDSTNRVYVNGERITQRILKRDDEIWIGPFKLIYTGTQLTQYDESKSFYIDALHLTREVKNGIILLDDISLSIQPQQFVALVGGSGAGKSTLMKALNGIQPANGEKSKVFYSGIDLYKNRALFSTLLGYVPQQDIIHSDLSVEHVLYYTAKMRLPSDYTKKEVQQRIDDVLKAVDMTDRRKLFVKELSGGQKKRVSIALELLAQPNVIFLDEPTSGLDPGLDLRMMHLLRDLADEGHTVVLVTHATNNIFLCDRVCFLAQGGKLAYYGPPHEAKIFFQKEDFAEIYTELEPTNNDPDKPKRAESRFKQDEPADYQKYVSTPLLARQDVLNAPQKRSRKREKSGRLGMQFWLLTQRYLELLWNDKVNRRILLFQAPIIGFVLVVFIHFGIGSVGGSGGFDPNILIQCPVSSQKLVNDQPALVPREQASSTDCKSIQSFLEYDRNGRIYAKQQEGVQKALQNFIVPGPGDAPKILFIIAFAAIMFGTINGTREIVKELHVYRRERAVNLGILPYLFSKVTILGALCLLQSAVLVLLIHLADPFEQSVFLPPILEIYITTALTSLTGLMTGLLISACFSNSDRAVSVVPAILLPQVIFSGLLFPLTNLFTQIPGLIFPIRWSMAALGSTTGLHSDKLANDALLGSNYTYHGTLFSLYTKYDATQYLFFTWCVLGAFIILMMCLAGVVLKSKDRQIDIPT